MIFKLLLIIKRNLFDLFFFHKSIKKIVFNLRYFKRKNLSKNIILFDNFEDIHHLGYRIFLLNALQKKHNAKLFFFGKIRSLLMYIYYFSIHATHVSPPSTKISVKENNQIFLNIMKKIKNKKDILNLKLGKIPIGIDLYESYLRDYSMPTMNIKDKNFKSLLKKTIDLKNNWSLFFKKNTVKAVIISHRNYVHTNIICRIAYQNKIPVYTFSGSAEKITKFTNARLDECKYYSNIFNKLDAQEKIKGINLAKKKLSQRFSGVVGVNMSYSTKSAFTNTKINKSLIEKTKKLNVLICTHCFFDNPHAYGGNLFADFYEWIKFLAKISHKTNYNWYIKPHPDYLPGTIEIIKKLSKNFKSIKLLNPESSFHQLKKEGLDFVLTTYGTVAHELPLLGINVINADKYNPNSSFKYSYTPNSLKNYRNIILNLHKFKSLIKYKKEIYKFYYIHHYFLITKNLFLKNKENRINSNYFSLNESNSRKILEDRIEKFLNSGNKYMLEDKKLKIINQLEKN